MEKIRIGEAKTGGETRSNAEREAKEIPKERESEERRERKNRTRSIK